MLVPWYAYWRISPRKFLRHSARARIHGAHRSSVRGAGVAIGSSLQDMQGFQLIMNFLVMPIYFLSGAMFPLSNQGKVLTSSLRSIRFPTASTECAQCS